MTWNERITQARTKLGITKSEFSRRVGVSTATTTDWETGTIKMIDGRNLVKVSSVLGVRPEWLITGIEDSAAGSANGSDEEVVAAINRFVAAYRNVSDEGRVFIDHAITAARSAYVREDKRKSTVTSIIDRRAKT